ncbi:hypothetical protein GALL_269330 [mine drainage metagenome]|uniref:Adhesin n=1 Tax=mine drainage metagenome TaxID=410659 RepID=A0A1J5R572_9ZZZZ
MKLQFKNTPIALAVAAMFLSPVAFASGNNDGGPDGGNYHDPVSIKKDISVKQDVTTKGTVNVDGAIYVDASSMAVVNDGQVSTDNEVSNTQVTNSATVGANVLTNASGNIGVNVTAGDNNQQANSAALSAADASFVFGSSDAEVFAQQAAMHNSTSNDGNTNTASLGGTSLQNASGNIGVNISAGNSNQQKNDLAASVAVARMATATVKADQMNGANNTTNSPIHTETVEYRNVSLALNAGGTYGGSGSGTYSGGSTSGQSYQANNIYPDMWTGNVHPAGSQTGHFDLDGQAQGAVNNPIRGNDSAGTPIGGLAFDNTGSYSGGSLGFSNSGDVALSGTVTGQVPVVVAVNLVTTNTASLADNTLAGASGNIGVNIAAGTNNQQFNGLAISATQAGTGTGGGSGGEPLVLH